MSLSKFDIRNSPLEILHAGTQVVSLVEVRGTNNSLARRPSTPLRSLCAASRKLRGLNEGRFQTSTGKGYSFAWVADWKDQFTFSSPAMRTIFVMVKPALDHWHLWFPGTSIRKRVRAKSQRPAMEHKTSWHKLAPIPEALQTHSRETQIAPAQVKGCLVKHELQVESDPNNEFHLAMALRITVIYQGVETVREFDVDALMIGRLSSDEAGLDLSADPCVSRRHATLQFKNDAWWLSDLGSRYGTQVNGREIREGREWRVSPEDKILIGETTLLAMVSPTAKTVPAAKSADVPSGGTAPNIRIVKVIDTGRKVSFKSTDSASPAERRLAILLDLPRQFSEQAGLNDLLQTIMNRVVDVIPAARRGALLLHDARQDALLLKGYVSGSEPAVSETLARRALEEKRGFIWRSNPGQDASVSIKHFQIVSGMYAPLRWQDKVYGVICVDSPVVSDLFGEEDLQFLIALGQYAAMALADREMRAEMARQAKLVERLMANFSPKLRTLILDRARQGKLRPGGIKSEVTVLFCDICGFTRQAAGMDPQDVVDMLNHYFQPMVDTLFRHDGTVDKFVGDAVLAVFGSPEPDPQQQAKAVRAALAMQEAVEATSQLRAARGDVTCRVRVGIHCGEVFHGFVGTNDRLEFTVIGDAVNRACRHCEAAAEGEILLSEDAFQRVFNLVKTEKTSIKTKEGDLTAYRVLGLRS